jgi:hypothetical protein
MAETVYSRRERAFGTDHPDTIAALEDLRRVAWVKAADQNEYTVSAILLAISHLLCD